MLPSLKSFKDWTIACGYFLAFAWAMFWVWFGIASGISEGIPPIAVVLHAAFPGAICLGLAITALFTDRIGAILLLAAGVLIGVAYLFLFPHARLNVNLFCELTLAAPPFLAGLLLMKRV